jgi:hypothetical protein
MALVSMLSGLLSDIIGTVNDAQGLVLRVHSNCFRVGLQRGSSIFSKELIVLCENLSCYFFRFYVNVTNVEIVHHFSICVQCVPSDLA